MDTIGEAKHLLRHCILSRLKSKSAEQRQRQSQQLCRQAATLLPKQPPLHVALFAPMEHEVDLTELLSIFPQHFFYFPICLAERRLEFRYVTHPKHDFVPGKHGIQAPGEHCPPIAPEELDFVFVPGVAFTRTGARLGYGGGYYDRFLLRCPQAHLIAAAFPEQIVDTVPTDKHDLPLPRILTVSGEP